MRMNESVSDYWAKFIRETNKEPGLQYYSCEYMGPNEKAANELAALILSGVKTATTSCLPSYQIQQQPIPGAGSLSIVTDWAGAPHCIIETTNVTILPFKEVTFEQCKKEGEDDNLQSWQNTHENVFTQEGQQEGYQFTWDILVVFEEFKVVFI